MIYLLLDTIQGPGPLVLVTILRTEGHTYKKSGDRALFLVGEPFPVYGNLGSLCVDQEILRSASLALDAGKPSVLSIDTRDATDVDLGYGSYCGGWMEVLIEPLLEAHKAVYREVDALLRGGMTVYLVHHVDDGRIEMCDTDPGKVDGSFVEVLRSPLRLVIVGATPLALQVVRCLEQMDFDVHVSDWRQAHLDRFRTFPSVTCDLDRPSLDAGCLVLILSHSFMYDINALEDAIHAGCGYIGLLSSGERRDHMFDAIKKRGIGRALLKTVCSPVGIDIGASTDAEIAVSIVAEITRNVRR